MIARLRGMVVEQTLESVVMDVNGVGYELFVSSATMTELTAESGTELGVTAWVHTAVREDAITLYGFASVQEKAVFESLLKVNGVGPKMALKILSSSSMEQLAQLVESGDVAALSKLPKVGRKTAEQLVLTLKGKLQVSVATSHAKMSDVRGEVASALIHLGYRAAEVERVVQTMAVIDDLQSGVREGLRRLSQNS